MLAVDEWGEEDSGGGCVATEEAEAEAKVEVVAKAASAGSGGGCDDMTMGRAGNGLHYQGFNKQGPGW